MNRSTASLRLCAAMHAKKNGDAQAHHRLIALPNICDHRGCLMFAQTQDHIPFPVERMFVLHSFADASSRGHHAHRAQHQFLVMLAGSCTVSVDMGDAVSEIILSSPELALYAPPMHWLTLDNFSSDAICLVLTSAHFDEADYIRDRAEFERLTHC